MSKSRGRPPCSAQWDGKEWVLSPDAAVRAAQKLVIQRENKERRRATRQALKVANPELFEKKIDQMTLPEIMDKQTSSY